MEVERYQPQRVGLTAAQIVNIAKYGSKFGKYLGGQAVEMYQKRKVIKQSKLPYKKVKKPKYNKATRQGTERNDEIAQSDIGYGTHEAKRLFTKKSKRRSRRQKIISKKRRGRKLRFKKAVRNTLNTRYPYQKTLIASIQQVGSTADTQNMYLGTIGTSNFGDGTDDINVRENDIFNIMAQQAATGSYDTRDKQIKFELRSYNWNCSIRNKDADPCTIELYQMVCKKSMKSVPVEAVNPNSEWVATQPASLQAWLFNYQLHGEMDNANVFGTSTYATLGIKPTDLTMISKYFTTEKIDRYEMAPGTYMTLNRPFYVRQKLSPAKITDHAALAGITRIFVFVVRGFPTRSSGTNYAASGLDDADGGLLINQNRTYNWRNDWDSYSRLTSGQQGEQFKTISVAGINTALLGSQLSAVTS